ncbi:MAG: endonuclease III domain-containing protein [Geobacteraceae bacterium]|nr:endonuclease III domain-containing protein [Geobacteraceae bacterium]
MGCTIKGVHVKIAILTQNTSWTNVEKAITALKQSDIMSPRSLHTCESELLARLIRPAGYFNVKSLRLKDFTAWLFLNHQGSLERMFTGDWHELRTQLLQVRGIGPETADSILLYAGNKPSFVVDSYTRRLFLRLGLLQEKAGYEDVRAFFMNNLPEDVALFNEYHAQIVQQCKHFCRTKPLCTNCPLCGSCPARLNSMFQHR